MTTQAPMTSQERRKSILYIAIALILAIALGGGLVKVGAGFADRNAKGFNWNNLMLQRWVDHNGTEHRVLDDYQRNVKLCDLTAQPDDIRALINETIDTYAVPKEVTQVGIRMLKFCNSYDMKKIADNIQQYAEPFQARYPESSVTLRKLTQG